MKTTTLISNELNRLPVSSIYTPSECSLSGQTKDSYFALHVQTNEAPILLFDPSTECIGVQISDVLPSGCERLAVEGEIRRQEGIFSYEDDARLTGLMYLCVS